jgi:AcrR family transcriptional regulator
MSEISVETLFMGEPTTREKILDVAIHLISKKGFDAVSIREIAREVGIRESSIYNHFKSKDEILDTIIDFFILELTRASGPAMEIDSQLEEMGPKKFMQYGCRTYMQYMNTPRIGKIWRIISIELYRNEKIRVFFQETIVNMPLVTWEQLFGRMIELKLIKPLDPKVMAREFFSFSTYLMFVQFILKYDVNSYGFSEETLRELDEHVDFFMDAIKIG